MSGRARERGVGTGRKRARVGVLVFSTAVLACQPRTGIENPSGVELAVTEETTFVEVVAPPEAQAVSHVEIPIPDNPYEDPAGCCCTCPCTSPCDGGEARSEVEAFVAELEMEASKRTHAAAEAVLASSDDILEYESWKDIVVGSMELLGNPTIVLVDLPGGGMQKVSLDKIGTLDLPSAQIWTIRKTVGAKMRAALAALMKNLGVPSSEAKAISGDIMDAWLDLVID